MSKTSDDRNKKQTDDGGDELTHESEAQASAEQRPEESQASTATESSTTATDEQSATGAGGDGGDGGSSTLPAPADGDGGRGQSGTAIAVLALVLVLLIAGAGVVGGWWVWERIATLEERAEAAADQAEFTELRDDFRSRDERLTGRVENLADEHASHVRALATVEESMTSVREDQGRIRENMERIEELAAAHRDDWIYAEASYLFGIARYRAGFLDDVDGALAALREADALLEELGGAAVDQRQQVARAIDALLEVSPPDRAGLAGELQELVRATDEWPIERTERRVEPPGISGQRDADLTSLDGWREASERAWHQFREAIGALVVVRRDDPPPRLMAPEESHYLRHNVRLQLMSARLALLEGDRETYQDSLETAHEWIAAHFDPDDASVVEALERIDGLREATIRAEVPDLSEYLPDQRVPGRNNNADEEDE